MYEYITVLFSVVLAPCAVGHGYLDTPPARNSMWRAGFDTPKNYDDMGLNCGGLTSQWELNGGKCGLCGDPVGNTQPRAHEAGGTYAPVDRPVSRCYNTIGRLIDITVRVTAYHMGYFEFRLCINNNMASDPEQVCIDNGYLLTIAGGSNVTRYDINTVEQEFYNFQLVLPEGVVCSQCILQWKYNAGNNWGCDEEGCGKGLGNQEQFINCADIAIVPDCTELPMTTDSVTSNTGGVTTETTLPPVTDGTSDHTTIQTAVPPTVCPVVGNCKAIGEWDNMVHMDGWCNFNCLHPTTSFCPATHCTCS